MKVTHKHEVDIPVSKLIEFYKDDEFYEQKIRNSGAISVEFLEREVLPDGRIRKKVRVKEPSRLPSFIRKSDIDEYVDENILDPEKKILEWKITPAIMADRTKLFGTIEFIPLGESKSMIVFNTEMEIKIPLIGRKAEKIALSKTEEEVERQVEFIKKWAKTH